MLFIGAVGQISADIYLPSLPAITVYFNTDNTTIQFSIAAYMFGFAVAQLLYGPISDRFGRRLCILWGLVVFMMGTIICVFAISPMFLIVGRLIQGFGSSACVVSTRAIGRDSFKGKQLAKISSLLMIGYTLLMSSSPIIGGYIEHYLNWRVNFMFLLIYAIMAFICAWFFLPETNRFLNSHATKPKVLFQNYVHIISNKVFLGSVICAGICYAGIISYLTAAPFLMQKIIGLSPLQFGWLSCVTAAAFISSGYINSKLISYFDIKILVYVGLTCALIAGSIMLLFAMLHIINILVIMVPVFIFVFGCGFVFGNVYMYAVTPFAKMAGASGALFGCLQIGLAVVASSVIAVLPETSQIPLAGMFVALGLIGLLSFRFLVSRNLESE